MKKNAQPIATAAKATVDLAKQPVTGGSGSNTVFTPRRNGETGIL
jgi:hypothetical protein